MPSYDPAVEPFIDAYAVLGVPEDATQATIKQAHRRLAWLHHPDRAPVEERAGATRRIQNINLAYGLVHNPTARARYDELRQARTRAVAAREASSVGTQWDDIMRQAGNWAGRWWRHNEAPLRRAAERAATRTRHTYIRVSSALTTVVYTWLGLTLALGAQQLLGSRGLLPPLIGGLGGTIAGTVQGRNRMRVLEGHPPMSRPWAPVALWLLALGLAFAGEATF
ncbi:MAG: J domain-containing protein [Egibacteraceae bacterium]